MKKTNAKDPVILGQMQPNVLPSNKGLVTFENQGYDDEWQLTENKAVFRRYCRRVKRENRKAVRYDRLTSFLRWKPKSKRVFNFIWKML